MIKNESVWQRDVEGLVSSFLPLCCIGLKHCKINIHLLSHIPLFVKQFGPLWIHSAFGFEDFIGYLVKKSHGTHDVDHQVILS